MLMTVGNITLDIAFMASSVWSETSQRPVARTGERYEVGRTVQTLVKGEKVQRSATSIPRRSRGDAPPPSRSAKTRRGASRPTWRSCQSVAKVVQKTREGLEGEGVGGIQEANEQTLLGYFYHTNPAAEAV
jgi:hypothetical protein